MRRLLIIAALLLARPALAGPQDVWTIDPRNSSLTFTATQVGAFVNGRFPSWTGEIVLDPAALAVARIDIRRRGHTCPDLAWRRGAMGLKGRSIVARPSVKTSPTSQQGVALPSSRR